LFIPNALAGIISFGFLPVFFATFPDGRFYPHWMRPIAVVFFFYALAWNLFPDVIGDFSGPLGFVTLVVALTMFIGSMLAQIQRYRKYSTPVHRQQTKWFLYGFVLIVTVLTVPSFFIYSVPLDTVSPATSLTFDLVIAIANLGFILLPVALTVSILRYRLWDIDVIIRRTLQYALLTGALALIYFGGVVLLQGLLEPLTGDRNSPLVTVLSTLAIAALFSPLRIRTQSFIDRRFYRRKYNAEQSLARFAATARSEVDLDRLAAALLGVVEESLQPEQVNIRLAK
jgi:hypothetical protein